MATQEDYQLAYSPIYELVDPVSGPKKDLWFDDMAKAYGAANGVNAALMGRTQLTINKMFSIPQLEAMGHTNDGNIHASVTNINTSQVESYFASRGVDTTTYPVSSSSQLKVGVNYPTSSAQAYLTSSYTTTIDATTQTWTIDSVEKSITTAEWDDGGGGGVTELVITMSDASIIFVPEASAPMNLAMTSFNNTSVNSAAIFQSGWEVAIEELDFFFGSYVLEYNVIADNMIKVMNNSFGFRHTEIKESIDNIQNGDVNVQNMWLCYAMPLELIQEFLPDIASYMEDLYQEAVTFTVDDVEIYYRNLSDGSGDQVKLLSIGDRSYSKVPDPTGREDELGVPLMIPLNLIEDMTIKERYVLKRYGLCFITTIQSVTDLKWYETGVFYVVAFFVGVVMAMFGMPQLLMMMIKGFVAQSIISGVAGQSEELAIIAGIVLGVIMMDPSKFALSLSMNTLTMVANYANQAMKIYFQVQQKELVEEYEEIQEGISETEAMIREQKGRNLYISFGDQFDGLMKSTYDDMYNIYNTWYNNQTRPVIPSTTSPGVI